MDWETPSFSEIDMSAEIGAYQSDDAPRPSPEPQFVQRERAATLTAEHAAR